MEVSLVPRLSKTKPFGWQGPPLEPSSPEPENPQSSSANRPWLWVLGGLLALIVIASLFTTNNEHVSYHVDKLGAWVAAQQFVLDRLKAPRTAKWPWASTDELVTYLGNREYLINAYVDAQNSFGALIRTYFTCRVRDDGDRWTGNRD